MTPAAGLARCVGDPGAFLASAFGRRPHLHHGPPADDLLSIADVDHLITASALRAPAFRLVRGGASLPLSSYTRTARVGSRDIADLVDPAAVARLFDEGATIVLQGLHRYWPAVTRLCRDLEAALTHPVQANAYLTPAGSQGLRVHADAHDVFALQSSGRKEWVVHADGPDAAATLQTTLSPGDVLYLPKGTAHAARTVAEPSLHLTVGVRLRTWADALQPAYSAALAQQRDPLPAGYAHDPAGLGAEMAERLRALASAIEKVDAGELAQGAADRFWSTRQPPLEGQLAQLLALDDVSDSSRLCKRPGARAALRHDGGHVVVVLADRELRLPADAEPALRVVLDRDTFVVGDLAPYLDDSSRLVLTRRLVREGLVTVADQS